MSEVTSKLKQEGFGLRDYFAGQALQALIMGTATPAYDDGGKPMDADEGFWNMIALGPGCEPEGYAEGCTFARIAAGFAYCYADAMMEVRSAREE